MCNTAKGKWWFLQLGCSNIIWSLKPGLESCHAKPRDGCLVLAGFEDSRTLARKMVKLYKLASEQLSQQDHYDFGMRAVKSVLVMAGSLRRSQPDLAEDVMLIRAMRDSNLPKFLAADIELFQNIISDLFPGVEVPFQVGLQATLWARGSCSPAASSLPFGPVLHVTLRACQLT